MQKHFWKNFEKIFESHNKIFQIVYKLGKTNIIGTLLEQIYGLEKVRTCRVEHKSVRVWQRYERACNVISSDATWFAGF